MDVIGCVYLMCFRFLAFQVLFPWGVPEHLTLGPPPRGRIASYLRGNYGLFSILGSRGAWGSFPSQIPILGGASDSLFVMGSPRAPYARAAPPGADRPHKQGEIMAFFPFFVPEGARETLIFLWDGPKYNCKDTVSYTHLTLPTILRV